MIGRIKNESDGFGFCKAFLCGFVLLLAATLNLYADPIFTPTVLISLAVSAALSAASIGLQLLFQPKPKPVDKNKLQGDIQITSTGEDIPIVEPYGAALGDGQGGIRLGGIIIYASQIRKTEITVAGQSGGGGKGAPKSPPSREYHYFIDLAIMWGRGPLRVKQVKANTDVLYQDFSTITQLSGTTYEAENFTTKSAGAGTGSDVDFSNLQKATLPYNEWVEWNNVTGVVAAPVEMYILYKSTRDVDIEVTVNGVVQRAVLPNSFSLLASINLPQTFIVGANTVRITSKTATYTLDLDRIVVGTAEIIPGGGGGGPGGGGTELPGCYLSGVRYEGWINPEPNYGRYTLRDPLLRDDRGCEQYNYQANRNSLGEVSAVTYGNGEIRHYPGNRSQLPDPLLQAYFEPLYGAGSTPAFRNRCYTVLENFEITKYSSVPNFTAVVEHETVNSVGELFAARSVRAGLDPAEFDYSALDAVPLRGYAITQKQAPAREMELLCRIYDVDVYEDFDGVIRGIIPDETILAAIPADELAAEEGKSAVEQKNEKPFAPLSTTFRDERSLPYYLDVSFFNPAKDWETGNVHSLRDVNISDRKDNIETGVVFTEAEAQKFADRELHKLHVEKDGIEISLFHKYTWLQPTNLITVEDTDGSINAVRLKSQEGWIPGAITAKGVSRDAVEFPPRVFVTANASPVLTPIAPPAPLIGTFVDFVLLDEQANPGFYAMACVTDPQYIWSGAGLYRLGENSQWEAIAGIRNQATMGRTIAGAGGVLAPAPGGYTGAAGNFDTTNSVTIDLFVDAALASVTDLEIENGKANLFVIGGELIQAATITRVGGYYSRFTLSRLKRKLRQTPDGGHLSADRAVLYSPAWVYIEQNPTPANLTERDYRFVSAGGDLNSASGVLYEWNGRTQFNTPVFSIIDGGPPVVTAAPAVALEDGYWLISIQRPSANGFTASIAEVRIRKSSDSSLVRQTDIGNTVQYSLPAQTFDSLIDYRWRNAYRLSGSDGWSTWSAATTVLASSPPPTPPPTTTGGDVPDPGTVDPPCFIDDTEILMADGSARAIQDITETDYVIAWSSGGRLMPARVLKTRRERSAEYHDLEITGDRLGVTGLHPFSGGAWNEKILVNEMLPNQKLRVRDKQWGFARVIENTIVNEEVWVNNLEIEHWHTFLVRGKGAKEWKAVYNRKLDPSY